jgi:hypothetical protein
MMSKRGLLQQKRSLKKTYVWCAPSSFQGAAILTSRIRTNRSKDKKTFARTVASRLREWNAPQVNWVNKSPQCCTQ